jgi:hypothetical protein
MSCMALAVAATLAQSAWALDKTVNSDAELRDAINEINLSGDANSTITLGSSFQLTSTPLPAPTSNVTIDTQGNTLTGAGTISWSNTTLNPATITLDGALVGGAGTAGSGATGFSETRASVVNEGGITGGAATGTGIGGAGVQLSGGTFVNNGTISGGSAPPTGGGGGIGISMTPGALATTLINNGTIQGGNSNGGGGGIGFADIGLGGVTLTNNGTIRGGSDLTGVNTGAAALSIRVANASPIVNTGTLEGGNGAVAISTNAAMSLVNSGTIRAGTGQANAIQFSSGTGALTLELQAGSLIVGNVVANAASTTNALILGGSANDRCRAVSELQQLREDRYEYMGFDRHRHRGQSVADPAGHPADWQWRHEWQHRWRRNR